MVFIQKIIFGTKKTTIFIHFVSFIMCYWHKGTNIGKQRMQPSKSLSFNGFVVNCPLINYPVSEEVGLADLHDWWAVHFPRYFLSHGVGNF